MLCLHVVQNSAQRRIGKKRITPVPPASPHCKKKTGPWRPIPQVISRFLASCQKITARCQRVRCRPRHRTCSFPSFLGRDGLERTFGGRACGSGAGAGVSKWTGETMKARTVHPHKKHGDAHTWQPQARCHMRKEDSDGCGRAGCAAVLQIPAIGPISARHKAVRGAVQLVYAVCLWKQ